MCFNLVIATFEKLRFELLINNLLDCVLFLFLFFAVLDKAKIKKLEDLMNTVRHTK